MRRLRIVKINKIEPIQPVDQNEKPAPLERFKAVTKDITEKALEIVNRISVNEMSRPQPKAEVVEEYYLLHHYLDFLKRLVSKKK